MNKLKKLLVLIVSLSILMTLLIQPAPVSAFVSDSKMCEMLKILKGDETGVSPDYLATKSTRLQSAIIYLRLKSKEEEALAFSGTATFTDAGKIKWTEGKHILAYLKANPQIGWLGFPDGSFKPNDIIDAQAMHKVLLEALGYKQDTDFTWKEVISFATSLGFNKTVSISQFTNTDIASALIEALRLKPKGSTVTLAQMLADEGIISSTNAFALGLIADPYAEKLKIVWLGLSSAGYINGQSNANIDMLNKRFNVEIIVPQIDTTNPDQMNLYWAEGKTADYIATGVITGGNWEQLADQGIIRSIPEEMIRKYLPNWMKRIGSFADPSLVKALMNYKGKVWTVPHYAFNYSLKMIALVRQDWMDNVGITKIPATLDELYVLFQKFRNNDPDKDGAKDTYAINGGNPNTLYGMIMGAFGFQMEGWTYSTFYAPNNKVESVVTANYYKDFLKYVSKLYKEGLIDPESVTDKRDKQRIKWSEGKLGILTDHPSWMISTTKGNVINMLTDKDPKAKLAFMPPVKGASGASGEGIFYPSDTLMHSTHGICFGKDTTDAKAIRIMQILDTICEDFELYKTLRYGEKGVDWVYNSEGIVVPTEKSKSVAYIAKNGLGNTFSAIPNLFREDMAAVILADRKYYEFSAKIPGIFCGIAFPTAGPNAIYAEKSADLTTIASEYYLNAISGEVNIDSSWDAYVKKFNDAGGAKSITEFQRLFDKFYK